MVLGSIPGFGGYGERGGRRTERESSTRFLPAAKYNNSSPEAKASRAFLNMLNLLSFDPASFAWIFTRNPLPVQKRALECLIAVIDILASRIDNQFYDNTEEYEFYLKAKRAQDAMAVYRENGMLP